MLLIQRLEPNAAKTVQELKKSDEAIYAKAGKTPGGRYLDNKAVSSLILYLTDTCISTFLVKDITDGFIKIIAKTELYKLAYKAPKGAHLHIHFNSCLGPNVLLDIAAEAAVKDNMYISTDLQGAMTKANLNSAKVQFHFLATNQDKVKSLFDPAYRGRKLPTDPIETYDKMLFQRFLAEFKSKVGIDAFPKSMHGFIGKSDSKAVAMMWLQQKLVFSANQVTYDAGKPDTVAKYVLPHIVSCPGYSSNACSTDNGASSIRGPR